MHEMFYLNIKRKFRNQMNSKSKLVKVTYLPFNLSDFYRYD